MKILKSKKKNPPKLTRLGRDSIFKGDGEDSCFTWQREHFETVDIHLGKSMFGWFITRTKNYTSPKDYFKNKPVIEEF